MIQLKIKHKKGRMGGSYICNDKIIKIEKLFQYIDYIQIGKTKFFKGNFNLTLSYGVDFAYGHEYSWYVHDINIKLKCDLLKKVDMTIYEIFKETRYKTAILSMKENYES